MQRVLPIYLAVDTSGSMASGRLEAVQEAIILLAEELLNVPVLGNAVRVGVVGFANDAQLVLPLTDLTDLRSLPRMVAGGATQYGPLFRLLSSVIERDVLGLSACCLSERGVWVGSRLGDCDRGTHEDRASGVARGC